MNSLLKHVLITMLLHCAALTLHAQLIIAKDPRACLTGLKDSSGKWVVLPQYTSIDDYWPYYKVHSGDKEGMISRSGKLIVPAIYDKVDRAYCEFPGLPESERSPANDHLFDRCFHHFVITNNERTGLAAPDGRVIIQPSLVKLTNFYHGVAIGLNEEHQNVLVDTSGILYRLPAEYGMYCDVSAFAAPDRFIVHKSGTDGNGNFCWLYGVCNARGKFILPAIYRGIATGLGRLDALVADSAQGNYGVFSTTGKQLLPCRYKVEQTPLYNGPYWSNDFVFLSTEGKKGVLGRQGKLIVPCSYDSFTIVRKSMHETLFLCHAPTHDDLYNDRGPILINHSYDHLRFAQANGSYLDKNVLILVEKNNKWGAISESLDEYMPVQFDTVFTDQYYTLFYSENSVRALYPYNPYYEPGYTIVPWVSEPDSIIQRSSLDYHYFGYTDTIGQPFKSIIGHEEDNVEVIDSIIYWRTLSPESGFSEVAVHDVWTADSVHLVWELPVNLESLSACESNGYNHDVTSCFAIIKTGKSTFSKDGAYKSTVGDKLYLCTQTANGTGIYKSTGGSSIVKPSRTMHFSLRRNSSEDTVGYIDVYSFTGKRGAMDMNGNMILDTLWYDYEALNTDTFWVCTESQTYSGCKSTWNLYSYSQHKLLLDTAKQLLYPPEMEAGEVGPALTTTGVGLFDTKTMRFTIPPVYQYIYPLDDASHYFVTTDFNGVSRITDVRGKAINKLTVDEVSVANKTNSWNRDTSIVDSFLIYSIRTSGPTLVAGNFGVHTYKSMNRDSLFQFLQKQQEIWMYNGRASGIPFVAIDSATNLYKWQRELLCDSLILGSMNGDYRESSDHSDYYSHSYKQQAGTHCDSWPYREYVSFYHEDSEPAYTISWNNKNALCFKSQQDILRSPSLNYETYFLQDSVPVKQTLSGLFMSDQWKPIIINALLARLDSQPDIRANCTDVNRYPELMENRFLVTADSLLLFPQWTVNRYFSYPEICVSISWTELIPYLKPEAKKAIGID